MERSMLCSKFYVEIGWRTYFKSNMELLFFKCEGKIALLLVALLCG